jgi:hypothetical protein
MGLTRLTAQYLAMMNTSEFLNLVFMNGLLPEGEIKVARIDEDKVSTWDIDESRKATLIQFVHYKLLVFFSLAPIDPDVIKLHCTLTDGITQAHYVKLTGEITPVAKSTNWEPEWEFIRFALGTSKGLHIKYEHRS